LLAWQCEIFVLWPNQSRNFASPSMTFCETVTTNDVKRSTIV